MSTSSRAWAIAGASSGQAPYEELLLPSILVVLYDLRRSARTPGRITFSIAHAVYFAACLYRVSYRAVAFSIGGVTLAVSFSNAMTLCSRRADMARALVRCRSASSLTVLKRSNRLRKSLASFNAATA